MSNAIGSWTKLELQNSSIKAGVQAVKDAAIPVVDAAIAIIQLVETISEIILQFFLDLSDPLVAAILAALEALKSIIEEIFQDAGIYALFVPPVSNPGYADKAAVDAEYKKMAYDTYTEPLSDLSAEARQSLTSAEVRVTNDLIAKQEELRAQGLAPKDEDIGPVATMLLGAGNGGNAGFYRTVADSMNDMNDPNRPNFSSKSYMAGMVFVGGANTYGDFLKLWQRLSKLFRGPSGGPSGFGVSLDNPIQKKPNGLRATVVSSFDSEPSGSGGGSGLYAVKLDWEPLPSTWVWQALGLTLTIAKVHIYKSDRPIKATTTVDQLEHLETIKYNPLLTHYYDKKTKFEANKTIYYAVGFTFTDKDGNTVGEGEPSDLSKAILQFGSKLTVDAGHGIPPDWVAGNLLDFIPALKEFIDIALQWINDIEEGIRSAKKILEQYVAFLKAIIRYYTNWVLDIANTVKAIIYLFDLPNVYIGTFAFAGEGGNQFVLDTLADKLTEATRVLDTDVKIKKLKAKKCENRQQEFARDVEVMNLQMARSNMDPNAPPFTKGSELVGGLVLLAGAEHPAGVDKAIALFNLFTSTADAQGKALSQALDSFDTSFDAQLTALDDATKALIQTAGEEAAGFGMALVGGTMSRGVNGQEFVLDAPENKRTAGTDKNPEGSIVFDNSMNPTDKSDSRC